MTYPRNHDDISLDSSDEAVATAAVASEELRLLLERIERLEEEKKGMADDIKDVFTESRTRGFDVKTMRRILAIRKKRKEEFQEEEALLETYMNALGMA